MPQVHLYRCSGCHKEIEITEKLAGMTQDCPFCDQQISYPGMREIRQLPVKSINDSKTDSPKTSGSFNETGSWLFSGGLLVAVVAGLAGLVLFSQASSMWRETMVTEKIEFGNSEIKRLPSGLLWDAWDKMTINGMPDWTETGENRYNKQSFYLSYIAYGLFAISFLGLVAMVFAFVNRR